MKGISKFWKKTSSDYIVELPKNFLKATLQTTLKYFRVCIVLPFYASNPKLTCGVSMLHVMCVASRISASQLKINLKVNILPCDLHAYA